MKATIAVLRCWGGFLLAATFVQSAGHCTEPTNPPWATVTIPYAELREARNSARLPDWIRQELQSNDYNTAQSGAELELQATWLPRVQTAQAMINRAEFHSRIVEDGGLLVAAEFTLQHEAPLSWRVHLPTVDQFRAWPLFCA